MEDIFDRNVPSRFLGLDQVSFYGDESLPSSKFSMIFGELKKRIQREEHAYSSDELKIAYNLVKLADNLQLMFVSQDTPLYSTQFSANVRETMKHLVSVQEPMGFNDLPNIEKQLYTDVCNDISFLRNERDKLLYDYVGFEKLTRSIDYSLEFNVTCLLGMSTKIRTRMEQLANFNKFISSRFNIMQTNVGMDNVYEVNYLLGYIDVLEKHHHSAFPDKSALRKGNFKKIFKNDGIISEDTINKRYADLLINDVARLQR